MPDQSGRTVPAPHPYTHVGSGRWVCEVCRVFIVNQDCRVNREAMTAPARRSS